MINIVYLRMKKINCASPTLVIALLTSLLLFLNSCIKSYECWCTIEVDTYSETAIYKLYGTHKKASKSCKSYEETTSFNLDPSIQGSAKPVCTLK